MVNKFDFWCAPAGQNRRIHLYLPDNYYNSDEKYPVLYFFDGHNLFFDGDATFGKCLGLKEFLDGWGKKVIVVGITCSSEDRTRAYEYIPYHIHSFIYGDVDGRGDTTVQWIVNDLKPFIDENYRTYPFRECTAIGGYSLGGMMALYAVLRYNNYFSKAAVISPSFMPAMEHFKREIINDNLSPDTRIFFSWGTEEDTKEAVYHLSQSILYLEKQVQQKGVKTYICCQKWGKHNEASWQYAVPEFMNFLFCGA
jgi:predicted alpha/beta superfamily hydrolase